MKLEVKPNKADPNRRIAFYSPSAQGGKARETVICYLDREESDQKLLGVHEFMATRATFHDNGCSKCLFVRRPKPEDRMVVYFEQPDGQFHAWDVTTEDPRQALKEFHSARLMPKKTSPITVPSSIRSIINGSPSVGWVRERKDKNMNVLVGISTPIIRTRSGEEIQ